MYQATSYSPFNSIVENQLHEILYNKLITSRYVKYELLDIPYQINQEFT